MTSPKTFLLLGAILALSTLPSQANILDDFQKGVNDVLSSVSQAACVVSHKSEFDECYSQVRGVYSDLQNQDNVKEFCCSYVAYRDCVEVVAYKHCGEKSTEIADSILSAFKSLSTVSQCTEYTNIWDCMDSAVRVGVLIAILAVVILVAGCVVKVCCSIC